MSARDFLCRCVPAGTRLGRGAEADVRIDCSSASRLHCEFEVYEDGRVDVTDLGSRNGTDLNGARLMGKAGVGADDQISVAGLVMLRVVPTSKLGPAQHVNPLREAGPGGTMPFNRPPRAASPPGPQPVRLPEPPRRADKPPFSISAMLGPVVVAGGMVVLLKEWSYALMPPLRLVPVPQSAPPRAFPGYLARYTPFDCSRCQVVPRGGRRR